MAYVKQELKGIKTVYSGCSIVKGGNDLNGKHYQLQEYNTDDPGTDVC